MTTIAHISDCHLFADKNKLHYNLSPFHTLTATLELIAESPPNALLVTGDISADDSMESYCNFSEALQQVLPHTEWRVLAGNHDNNEHFDHFFKDKLLTSTRPWHFDDCSLIGLDTRYKNASGKIRTTELLEVHTHLLKNAEKNWIVAMHHPPFPLDNWMKLHECKNYNVFPSWLAKQNNVNCLLHGHLHAETNTAICDVPVLGVPSTCWQFNLSQTFEMSDKQAGYRSVHINKQGEIITFVERLTSK